jgi:hypothetical protein
MLSARTRNAMNQATVAAIWLDTFNMRQEAVTQVLNPVSQIPRVAGFCNAPTPEI